MLLALTDAFFGIAGLLLLIRLAVLVVGAVVDVVRRRGRVLAEPDPWPRLSVIIPAFNEERVLEGTVLSATRSDYPDLEVVVVDDGSTDRTLEVARHLAEADGRVVVVPQSPNQGKAAALNAGIARASGAVLLTVDADTLVAPDALRLLVSEVSQPGVSAAASNLKVGNRVGWLSAWQSIEYVTGLNVVRRAQATLGCITTIPGAAAAFRREAVEEVGGFSSDTTTEDTDLTLSLLERGHRVRFVPAAHSFTEAPTTLGGLMRQRTRWMHGYLRCLLKHRRAFLRLDALGLFGMPNLLFVHLLGYPLFVATVPYLARVTEWTSWQGLASFAVGLFAVDFSISAWSYLVDREHLWELRHQPLWRVGWPFFLVAVFARVWWEIAARSGVRWNKLVRSGHLADSMREGGAPGVIRASRRRSG